MTYFYLSRVSFIAHLPALEFRCQEDRDDLLWPWALAGPLPGAPWWNEMQVSILTFQVRAARLTSPREQVRHCPASGTEGRLSKWMEDLGGGAADLCMIYGLCTWRANVHVLKLLTQFSSPNWAVCASEVREPGNRHIPAAVGLGILFSGGFSSLSQAVCSSCKRRPIWHYTKRKIMVESRQLRGAGKCGARIWKNSG